MKKIFGTLLTFILLALVIVVPVAAQNQQIILPTDEIYDGDYFGFGETVQISGTVNGDAYAGGGTILVDGTVNGDLLAGGGNVTVTGDIEGDIRVGGGNVTVTGATIGGNITVGGGNVTIDSATELAGSLVAGGGNIQVFAPIGKGATIGGGAVTIGNTVGGDIIAGVGELSLTSEAQVTGDLTYWSENEASIAQGATVSGVIMQELPEASNEEVARDVEEKAGAALAGFFITLKIVDIAWLVIIGLIVIYFAPNYTQRAAGYVKTKFGWNLLIGLAAVILIPIVGIIFAITLFGIPIAITLFFAFFVMLWFARFLAVYSLGRFAMAKVGNKKATSLAYIVGVVIYLVLSIIPIINFITDILISLSGLGSLLATKKEYYQDLRKKKIL